MLSDFTVSNTGEKVLVIKMWIIKDASNRHVSGISR